MKEIHDSDPRLLAAMMDSGSVGRVWHKEEFGTVLRHQLAAPLHLDLGRCGASPPEDAGSAGVRTFKELLHHRKPPLAWLERLKSFAKNCRNRSDSPLPDEVATVLYFAAIAVGLLRYNKRLTRLDNTGLRHGFEWSATQTWVDTETREIFAEALRHMSKGAA